MRRAAALLVASLAVAAAALADPAPGWQSFPIFATGSYYDRYLPAGLDLSQPVPLVVFLHGAGSIPLTYRPLVQPGADAAGAVVVMPKSGGIGWGYPSDEETIRESVRLVRQELPMIDPQRIAVAGHSAGGAYAYLIGYGTVGRFSAVFSMSAPYVGLDALADPAYTPPLRLYYGTADPNYTGGDYAAIAAQLTGLGVAVQSDIEAGYGHSTWPQSSMEDGFRFLVAARYPSYSPTCSPTTSSLCLGNGRFQIAVAWRDGAGASGAAHPGPPLADPSGLLWFFAPANIEMLLKVLDGCGVNGHFWVFAAATTNVGYTLTVTDTVSGATRSYENPPQRAAPALTDTSAFVCATR